MRFEVSLSVEVTSYILYFLGLVGFIPNYKSFYNLVHWFMIVVIYTPRINNDNGWLRYQTKLSVKCLYSYK